jgi:antitoxin ParD1/3/4
MSKNTSILLGEYFENFINEQVKSGRFSSASEVIRNALRLFEQEESQNKALVNELKKGEKSGFVSSFDKSKHLKNLHAKRLKNGL